LRIKKLELIGFKSFKDRTVIHFDAGITGVVGPNGCGKSNIVDALVWVMGEMSAKHLRGSSMEDVIFAGAEGYAPVGMAEVSLTLENDGGPFPVKYLNHSEIMLTRRLHRSGESQYLINKEPARLRDIHEIFMDTGAGSKGFSIIEQGAIGKIVTAKPEDRRSLIEEAAGITKFKARKRESQRRLKSTESNLVRLQDIITELKRQLDSLQRQAQRAERYRNLKREVEEIELWVASKEYMDLFQQNEEAQKNFEESQTLEVAASSGLGNVESRLSELRAFGLEKEKSIEDFRGELQGDSQRVRDLENIIQELKFEIEQAKRTKEMAGSIFEGHQVREKALLEDFNQTTARLAELQKKESELTLEYGEKKSAYEDRRSRIDQWDEELSQSRRQLLTSTGAETQIRAKTESFQESILGLEGEFDSARGQLEELETAKSEAASTHKKNNQSFEDERQLQLSLVKDVETYVQNKRQVQSDLDIKTAIVNEAKDKLNEVSSRLYGLESLKDNYEGYQAGTKSVMGWQSSLLKSLSDSEKKSQTRFRPLADVVKVDEKYEVAFEAALGPKMQMLISSSSKESLKAVDYLKEKKSGRSTFFSPMGTLSSHDSSESSLLSQAQGFQCFLKDKVQVPEADQSVLQALVQNVAVVDSVNQGLELRKQFPAWTFVTESGDLLSNEGFLTGGSSEDASSGVLQREREIRDLQGAREEWDGKLALAVTVMDKLGGQLIQLASELEGAQKSQTEKEILVAGLKKDVERSEHELEKANRAVDNFNQELERKAQKISDKKGELTGFETHLSELTSTKVNLEKRIDELSENLDTEKLGIGDLQEDVTRLQVESATRKQELLGVESEHQRLEKSLADVRSQMQKMDDESSKNVESMSGNQVQMEEKKVELELLIEKVEAKEGRLKTMRDDFEQNQQEALDLQNSVGDQLAEKSRLQKIMNESQLVLEQSQMKIDNLKEQILEKYQKSLSEVAPEIAKKAKSQLNKVIDRINRICSKRFKETFASVNTRFQRVFPVLFGGGEAKLILIEDPEKSEMGIDIVAKPPGKKLQSVSLLSGGEKALTAVSLIFSIFLVKPSPYCLLDEVDAPLDDANVMRFNDLVREMAKRSQIIVVTHNKFTMEIAEKLYGVTMEEKGVSKMVSVDLDVGAPVLG